MSTLILKGGSNGRLMVVLPYSVEGVARMKTIPGRRWHPEEKRWSVPHADEMVERLLALFATVHNGKGAKDRGGRGVKSPVDDL